LLPFLRKSVPASPISPYLLRILHAVLESLPTLRIVLSLVYCKSTYSMVSSPFTKISYEHAGMKGIGQVKIPYFLLVQIRARFLNQPTNRCAQHMAVDSHPR
jgi:hypothetical protein